MKKISIFIISILLFYSSANGQITIGHNTPAVPGALLQLKENDNPGANASRGLILPRMQLTGHNLDVITKSTTDTPDMYTGLTVWNIRGIGDICKGANTWTGTRWVSLMPKPKDMSDFNTSTGILTDHEGNTYTTAEFGSAGRWMTANLRTRRAPGSCDDVFFPSEITENQWINSLELQVIMYPNSAGGLNSPATWTEEQGMLYTWSLATNGKGGADGRGNVDNPGGSNIDEKDNQAVQRQGICPTGWHLPSLKEWKDLLAVLETDATTNTDNYGDYSQANVGTRGGITTIKSNTILNSTVPRGASKTPINGGFNALMTGSGAWSGSNNYGTISMFWTASSSGDDALAHLRSFSPNDATYNPSIGSTGRKNWFYAVRCKKD